MKLEGERIHRKKASLLGSRVFRLNQTHSAYFTPQQPHPIRTRSLNSLLNEIGQREVEEEKVGGR